jgi:hypothetical protein
MTIRRWTLVIAVIALTLAVRVGVVRITRRNYHLIKRAQMFAFYEHLYRHEATLIDQRIRSLTEKLDVVQALPPTPTLRLDETSLRLFQDEHEKRERRSAYYARLKEKYTRAARYPWLPFEPDPPEPPPPRFPRS